MLHFLRYLTLSHSIAISRCVTTYAILNTIMYLFFTLSFLADAPEAE